MEESPIEKRGRKNAALLIILILIGGTALFYLIREIPTKHKTNPSALKDTLTSPAPMASAEDSIEVDTFLYASVPATDSTHGKITPPPSGSPQNNTKTTGTLRLLSAQGFWFDYTGEIVNGKANGKGKAVYENGNVYTGNFKNNERNGYGKATTRAGEKYEGQWKNDRFNGSGIYTWKNGDYYIGHFVDARRQGEGKLYNKDGKLLKEGIWENDAPVN